MLSFARGDIWSDPGHKVVTVNCVGAPGKGLALQWAMRYPEHADLYRDQCRRGLWHPGLIAQSARYPIILAATKDHWRHPSRMEWVAMAISRLAHLPAFRYPRIAVPPLGCGLGGLDWRNVRGEMLRAFPKSAIEFVVYEPKGGNR